MRYQPLPRCRVDLKPFLLRPHFVVRETAPPYGDWLGDGDSPGSADWPGDGDRPGDGGSPGHGHAQEFGCAPAHSASLARVESPADAGAPADLGFPEAGTVHELLRALHGIGNEVRLRFLDALRMLYDGDLCIELGYTSFQQYCDRELGLARSTSLEYLRVARALDGLPRLRVLFGHGELSWEQVRAITRVATESTEVPWIELAFDEPVPVLLAEVREAQRTRRDAPREKRYGLPNLMVRLCLDLTLEDKERVRAAFELVGSSPGADLGGGPGDPVARDPRDPGAAADPRPPLVRWADGILSGAIPAWPVGRDRGSGADRPVPAQTILYRTCPECRETTLDTADGPLSVAPERLAELAPVSLRVEIAPNDEVPGSVLPLGEVDAPNSPRLTRQVLHRDGLQCANPGCGRKRDLQAHHIVFRSHGGPSDLTNEVTVCGICHALLHRGLLEVTGSPGTGLTWQPRPLAAGVKVVEVRALRARLRALASTLPPPAAPRGGPGRSAASAATPSTSVDGWSHAGGVHAEKSLRDIVQGLTRLGLSRAESEQRVHTAFATLMAARAQGQGRTGAPEPLDEEAILMLALRG